MVSKPVLSTHDNTFSALRRERRGTSADATSPVTRPSTLWYVTRTDQGPLFHSQGFLMTNDARATTDAIIKTYYEAFNRGDSDAMLALLADDVIHDVNQGERRTGKERFRAFNARMAHNYQERLEGITVMSSPDGSRAAAEFMVHGVYKNTDDGLPAAKGQTYVLPAGTFFAVANGKISRVTTYYNLTDWLVQVTGETM
jgi:steroid delta-isomerase-like uncharacterized protein